MFSSFGLGVAKYANSIIWPSPFLNYLFDVHDPTTSGLQPQGLERLQTFRVQNIEHKLFFIETAGRPLLIFYINKKKFTTNIFHKKLDQHF
jgi:hypothetical protein